MTFYFRYIFFLIFIITYSVSCKKDTPNKSLQFIGVKEAFAAYNDSMTVLINNFSSDRDTVKLNGIPCHVIRVKGDSVEIIIPKAAGQGYFTVTDGIVIAKGPFFHFYYSSYVTTLAGLLDSGSVDGTGLAAGFGHLDGVVVNSAGTFYGVEFTGGNPYIDLFITSSRIRSINAAGVVTTFAGSGQYGFKDGPAGIAEFGELSAIAIDASDNLYVSDDTYQKIRKITPSGNVSTIAGSGNTGSQDGPADSASFNHPVGLAVDKSGNVYVVDNGNFTVRRISPDGTVTTLTINGFVDMTNSGQARSTFTFPWALCLDLQGNLLLGDKGYIWKITPGGSRSVFAGIGETGHYDGLAQNASFETVEGLAVDSRGKVYAADMENHLIRQITPFGVFSFAGIQGQFNPVLDGPWQSATFISPAGLTIDKDNNVYVADFYRLRKIVVQ